MKSPHPKRQAPASAKPARAAIKPAAKSAVTNRKSQIANHKSETVLLAVTGMSPADFIIEQVSPFAEADDTRIVATIAGGRKTMGALLYACMTILAREQDRLTHVLVGEPYETGVGGQFFFPDQPRRQSAARDGSTVDASEAHVELADAHERGQATGLDGKQ